MKRYPLERKLAVLTKPAPRIEVGRVHYKELVMNGCMLALLKLHVKMYGAVVHEKCGEIMDSVSVNKFRANIKTFVERIVADHSSLKVTRRSGESFVVVSADDWERDQETLYVLQNKSLMKQIADSMKTHNKSAGYQPTKEEVDAITGI